MKYSVYKLINPINGNTFYIGKTSQSLEKRLLGHISGSKRNCGVNIQMDKYINAIIKKNHRPEIVEICQTAKTGREEYYIKLFAEEHELLNSCQITKRDAIRRRNQFDKQEEAKRKLLELKILSLDKEEAKLLLLRKYDYGSRRKKMSLIHDLAKYDFLLEKIRVDLKNSKPPIAPLLSEIVIEATQLRSEMELCERLTENITSLLDAKEYPLSTLKTINDLLSKNSGQNLERSVANQAQ